MPAYGRQFPDPRGSLGASYSASLHRVQVPSPPQRRDEPGVPMTELILIDPTGSGVLAHPAGPVVAPRQGKPPESPDFAGLIHRIADGDRDALGELYDATVANLFALARSILGNAADAEEVACDVYAQVWQNASRYSAERGPALTWMLVMCRSRALDRLRRNRVRQQAVSLDESQEEDIPATGPGPEDLLNLVQQGTAVHRALESLTPLRRQLVSLAFLRGLSHLEIAQECRLPVGTVKSHIRRALTALRSELGVGGLNVSTI